MTKTLAELIDRAYDIEVYFNVDSYELHQCEDGSYVDFHVWKVTDIKTLSNLAGELKLKFFAENNGIIVRLFER